MQSVLTTTPRRHGPIQRSEGRDKSNNVSFCRSLKKKSFLVSREHKASRSEQIIVDTHTHTHANRIVVLGDLELDCDAKEQHGKARRQEEIKSGNE